RSLNGVDTDDASGQRIRAKRAAQAEYLANLVQTRQTSDPTERIVLVGDFNAFEFHDGYVDVIGTIKGTPVAATEVVRGTSDLVNPDLTDLIDTLPANARYTYSFSGSAQSIDHAIVNAAALPSVSRFAVAHVDADFPDSFRSDPNRPERISDHDGTVTYFELAAPSQISIGDVSQAEGNSANSMTFVVTLSAPQAGTVTVNYTTNDGTATAGSDYTTTAGTVTFLPGDVSENIVVPILGDAVFEGNETFTVTLSAPSANATILDGSATGTLQNDDAQRLISVNDPSVAEGDAGTTPLTFNVTLDAPATSTVTVDYATSDGSAIAGSDYASATGTVTFNVGDASEDVVINVTGDTNFEPNETLTLTLSNPSANALISDPTGTGTIVNDEGVSVISINDVSLNEGNAGTTAFTFAVTLSAPPTSTVTVDYATSNGSASAGSDYTGATGTVTFVAGDSSENVTINVSGDTTFETNETFVVTLSNPSINATIADGSGTGTIVNDDGPLADLSITKTASDPTPQTGDQITYTIVVTNNGPDTATAVTVTDDLPDGMDVVSANSTIGSCTTADPVVCTVGTLNNGQSATITLTVLLTGAPGQYVNTAVADSAETDPSGAAGPSTIIVAPANINGIPTLSEWALIGLMTMLAAIAALKLK
ncbi:MAG TPA: IPTL-CTERM sorting domain-containing protein, partial [Thermoanaerobaculia bacterium]